MKRLANRIEKVNAHVLGLDVHKESIVWLLLDWCAPRILIQVS